VRLFAAVHFMFVQVGPLPELEVPHWSLLVQAAPSAKDAAQTIFVVSQ
jgi:hypothetical protein